MTGKNGEDAFERLQAIVGQDRIVDDPAMLASFAQGSIERGREPKYAVQPKDRGQVEAIIDVAKELHLNLVPASSGAPHRKGGVRLEAEGIVVDLSRMKRVILVDRRNKVAVVEPGVTFPELKRETDKAGLKILTPLLPKRSKSVLASYLDRDPILIPKYHWDMTDPLLCTEVVFGNGRLYRTGTAGGPGSLKEKIAAKSMFKNPLGPGQTDLVKIVQGSQGTMGIVTWASVKLEVKPRIHRLYFAADNHLERLIDFAYRVLRPKLADEFFLLNRPAFAAMVSEGGDGIERDRDSEKEYVIVYGVSGYDVCPEDRVAYQEEDIGKIAQSAGVRISNVYMRTRAGKVAERIEGASPEPYYKEAQKGDFQDILFLSTMDRVEHFVRVASEVAREHGYPPSEMGVYVQPILFGRACHIEFSFGFNGADVTEAESMRSLYRKGSEALAEAGGFFSRPYGYWSKLAYGRCPDTVAALQKVKDIFDPEHILNRGKLVFDRGAVA